jgi:hypothetical protein
MSFIYNIDFNNWLEIIINWRQILNQEINLQNKFEMIKIISEK